MFMQEYNRFEKARIIGARALQISRGATPLVKLEKNDIRDPIKIAEEEFKQGVIPLNIKKPDNS